MRLTKQKRSIAGVSKARHISLHRKISMSLTREQVGTTNQEYWKSHIVGNYIYFAAGTAGIHQFHITDDGDLTFIRRIRLYDPLGAVSSYDARGLCHIGDTLFVTAWKFAPITATRVPGYIATYDIGTPETFGDDDADRDHINTYEGVPVVPSGPTETPAWIQDPVTDGTYIYVAAQYDGMYVYNAAALIAGTDPVHGTGMHTNADHPPTFWEASNITMTRDKKHVIMSNHGTGGVAVSIINIENPAAPVLTKRVAQWIAPNGDPLRVRSVHAFGDYLYCSPNSDGPYINSPYRGLLVLDISDPANIPDDGSTWIQASIPADDQDNQYFHGHAGDSACVGIYAYGSFAYLTNGHNGVATFDIKDPTNPKYIGILTTCRCIRQHTVNLYHARPFYMGGKSYLIYGTGPESHDAHKMFLDEITIT